MKHLLCLVALLFLCTFLAAVQWNVSLVDTYGDGWNGGTLTVKVNGVVVLNNITMAGFGPVLYSFQVKHGDQITTIYTAGSWPGENEYSFVNQSGTTVLTNGAGATIIPTSIVAPFLAETLVTFQHQIGIGTVAERLPINPFFGYSYSQSIYLRSSLPTDLGYNRISKIKYYWNGSTSATNSLNWTVYLGHTTRTQFISTFDWVPLAELTQVFSGNVHLLATAGWVEITLDQPFDYDGASNLVVAVDENTTLYDSSTAKFLSSSVSANRSLSYNSDTINPNPNTPPTAHINMAYTANIIFQTEAIIYPPQIESFNKNAIPLGWAQYYSESFSSNFWNIQSTSAAGGTPYEMRAQYRTGVGVSRLISPTIKTLDCDWLTVSFKHFFDDYAPGVTAKLQYSSDMNNWTDTGWSYASGGGDNFGNQTVTITGPFPSFIYLAWTLDGDHFNFDYWNVDDVSLTVPAIDALPLNINVEEAVNNGAFIPRVTVRNNGVDPATFYVTLNYGNAIYTNTQQVVNLAPGDGQQVNFPSFTPYSNYISVLRVTASLANDNSYANDQISKPLVTLDLNTQAYADVHNYYTPALKGPSTFNLSTPGTVTHLGSPSQMGLFLAGADWIGNHWYGTEYSGSGVSNDNYWRIDHITGAETNLGTPGVTIHGIAYDPETDILYGTSLSSLYTLNRYTGLATLIGSHVICNFMIGIAYNHMTNTLYGVDLEHDALYNINTSTGAATLVGSLGILINLGQDLAFDRDKGYLFLAGYSNGSDYGPRLYWIHMGTGTAYKIGNFPPDNQMIGFAIPYDAKIPNVTIAANGTLSWPSISGATEYRIYGSNDPFAASYTYLGSTPSTSWVEPGFPLLKRFYKVTSVYAYGREISDLRLGTDFKDPLSGEVLNPQPQADKWMEQFRKTADVSSRPTSVGPATGRINN